MGHVKVDARWRSRLVGALALSVAGGLGGGAADAADEAGGQAGGQANGGNLPAVRVEGAAGAETATSPVPGYVATRSAVGTKSDTSLIETPQSISVITRDQMDQQGVQNLNDALHYTASVTPETRGAIGSRYDMFKVRGFDADTYWNGLKLGGNGWYILPQVDEYFMERIDVIKGPTSPLYGQARAGGVVDMTGKLPTAEPQHEIGFEGGTFSHLRGTVDLSGPATENGRLLYRLVGIGLDEDGQQRLTKNQRIGVMPSFTLLPGDETKINIYGLYQRDPSAGSYGTIPPVGSVLPARLGKIPVDFYDGDPNYEKFERTQAAIGYQLESKLAPPLMLRMNGRWFHSDQDYRSIYGTGMVDDDGTLLRNVSHSLDNADTFAFDNQLEGKFATGPIGHTVLGGFDVQHLRTSYRSGGIYDTSVIPSINVYNPQYYLSGIPEPALTKTSLASEQYGAYLQDQLALGGFLLTLSGRYDWAMSKTLTDGTSQFDRAATGRAGLTYVFANGIAPYVSYSQSFVPQAGFDAITGKALDPEKGHQYEVGVKYQPTGMKALFTAALFDLDRSNLMTYVGGLGYVQNGEARSRGLDLEARAEIIKDLNLIANYTYLDTKYVKDDSGLQGKRLAGIPRNTVSVWADYKQSTGRLAGLGGGVGVRSFDASANMANTFNVDGATLVDAALHYDLGAARPGLTGATVYVNAKNLLDKDYVASCYYGDSTGASNWCGYGAARTVVAGLRYRW